MTGVLADRKVLITAADTYMGPAIAERFTREGADVVADAQRYDDDPALPAKIVEQVGRVDVLVVNRQPDPPIMAMHCPAHKETEAAWQKMFNRLVHPTMRFVSAVLPQMIERKAGKIVVVTSAAPLRAIPRISTYSAARGAQNSYVKVVGEEGARHNVQINAVAQNFTIGGFPTDAMEDPATADLVKQQVPARRLATGEEQAALCLFLASSESDFFSGQIFPFAGGWVTT